MFKEQETISKKLQENVHLCLSHRIFVLLQTLCIQGQWRLTVRILQNCFFFFPPQRL